MWVRVPFIQITGSQGNESRSRTQFNRLFKEMFIEFLLYAICSMRGSASQGWVKQTDLPLSRCFQSSGGERYSSHSHKYKLVGRNQDKSLAN